MILCTPCIYGNKAQGCNKDQKIEAWEKRLPASNADVLSFPVILLFKTLLSLHEILSGHFLDWNKNAMVHNFWKIVCHHV